MSDAQGLELLLGDARQADGLFGQASGFVGVRGGAQRLTGGLLGALRGLDGLLGAGGLSRGGLVACRGGHGALGALGVAGRARQLTIALGDLAELGGRAVEADRTAQPEGQPRELLHRRRDPGQRPHAGRGLGARLDQLARAEGADQQREVDEPLLGLVIVEGRVERLGPEAAADRGQHEAGLGRELHRAVVRVLRGLHVELLGILDLVIDGPGRAEDRLVEGPDALLEQVAVLQHVLRALIGLLDELVP